MGTQVIMKVVFISAILAVASAGFAPTCDECNAAAQGLLERLTSAESIAEQTGILISQVCPQAADAAACEAAFSQYWGDMAGCLYPAFIGASDACQRLGLCKVKSALGDWTCDDCTAIMTSLRLHGGARYYRTGNRNPPRRVLLRSSWPHS